MFGEEKKGGRKLPGIPGSYGHEEPKTWSADRLQRQRAAARRAEQQQRERTGRPPVAQAPTATGTPTDVPSLPGGPTFTGGTAADVAERRQDAMRGAKRAIRTVQGIFIAFAVLAAIGVVAGDDEPTTRDPGGGSAAAGAPYRATDARALLQPSRLAAAIATAAREGGGERALITRANCYAQTCVINVQDGEQTTMVTVDHRLAAKTREFGYGGLPGTDPDQLSAAALRMLLAGAEDRGVTRDDLLRISLEPADERAGTPAYWRAVYYVEGDRRQFSADLDGGDLEPIAE